MFKLRRLGRAEPADSEWMIETEDESAAEFPSDSKLKTLFEKYAPEDGLVVKERGRGSITVRVPSGVMPQDGGFLKALWDATTFK